MQAETSGAGGVQGGKVQLLVLLLLVLLATTSSLALDGEDTEADAEPQETLDHGPPAAAASPSASSLLPLPPCSLASSAPPPPAAHALRGLDKEGALEILRDLLAVLPESDALAERPAKRRGFPSVQEGQVAAGRSWGAGGGQSALPPSSPRLLTKARVPLVLEGDPLASFLETLGRPRVSAIDNPAHLDDLLRLDLARRPFAARACVRPRLLGEGEGRCVGAVPSCEPRPARRSASVQATR